MINHIDVGTVLRRTVCDLYSDLVTRPTGAAVRTGIEQQLEEIGDRTLTVIDFSRVGLLDFSCADEIVAKLLLRARLAPVQRDAYFVFRGVSESHLEAIEAVLSRHGLALVALCDDGAIALVGELNHAERRAWEALSRLRRAQPLEVAREAQLEPEMASTVLDGLWKRRLVMRLDDWYLALGVPA
ncbi:MAG: hypothetical protein WKG32_14720 [Gemmatimonadaceae bacterium]